MFKNLEAHCHMYHDGLASESLDCKLRPRSSACLGLCSCRLHRWPAVHHLIWHCQICKIPPQLRIVYSPCWWWYFNPFRTLPGRFSPANLFLCLFFSACLFPGTFLAAPLHGNSSILSNFSPLLCQASSYILAPFSTSSFSGLLQPLSPPWPCLS